MVRGFKRLPPLDEDAALGAPSGADHDRRRRCQPEGAGAGDDQHGDESEQCHGKPFVRWGEIEPEDEGGNGDTDDHRHEIAGYAVGKPLDRRLAPLRLLHQPHDLLQHRVAPDPGGTHAERAGPVERGTDDRIACLLLHRQRLAGQHALVHRRGPIDHLAIHRDLLPRPDQHQVSHQQFCHRYVGFAAAAHHPCRLRLQPHECPDGAAGLAPGPCLKQPPHQDQGDDDGGNLVVDPCAAGVWG